MTTQDKIQQTVVAVLLFAAVVGAILFIAARFSGRRADRATAAAFLLPTVFLLAVGLVYPAGRTVYYSFFNAAGTSFIGVDNYKNIFTDHDQLIVLRNSIIWVVLTPFMATAIGLVYAILVDKVRWEAAAKALIFMPVAISFVGASIIWKFVYDYRPDEAGINQIGLLNQVLIWLGGTSHQWLLLKPWNNVFLVVIMIWIQTGFAMTVLSAAIRGIPDDIIEAARLDGVGPWGMFRFVTVPSIRPAIVVVLTTIGIATLKVFDIVRTTTGGQFDTSVIANEFYTQSFRAGNQGLGAALAVVLFLLVIPIVAYNVRQLRREERR